MAELVTYNDFPEAFRSGAVAVGNFDGVHRGHAVLVERLVETARRIDGPAIAMTFDPPPTAILQPNRFLSKPITTVARRAELLGSLGVDALVVYPTDAALLSLTAEQFFRQKIVGKMDARAMVEGQNFRFGKDRKGDTDRLQQLCHESSVECCVVSLTGDTTGTMISSTRIRRLLADGRIADANNLLTKPFQMAGIVSRGAGRGRGLGFPTANLKESECLIPGPGVYSGIARVAGHDLPTAINIGPSPTFGEQEDKIELHVIGWSGDLYGHRLTCDVLRKIRDVRRFDSVEALKAQLQKDVADCLPCNLARIIE